MSDKKKTKAVKGEIESGELISYEAIKKRVADTAEDINTVEAYLEKNNISYNYDRVVDGGLESADSTFGGTIRNLQQVILDETLHKYQPYSGSKEATFSQVEQKLEERGIALEKQKAPDAEIDEVAAALVAFKSLRDSWLQEDYIEDVRKAARGEDETRQAALQEKARTDEKAATESFQERVKKLRAAQGRVRE